MDFIPKFAFKVLKSGLKIIFGLFEFNFIEVFLNFGIVLEENRQENWFEGDSALPVMEVVEFEWVEFGEGEFSED